METFKLVKSQEARAIFGRSKTSFYQDIHDGFLPSPIKTGARSVVWVESEIAAVARARIAGFDDEKIRALVAALVEKRALLAPLIGSAG